MDYLTEETIPSIQRVNVSLEELNSYSSEGQFTALAYKLLLESVSINCIASCILGKTTHWNRDYAIVGGSLVRLHKLLDSILDLVGTHNEGSSKFDVAVILIRMCFESCVNIRYFIKNYSYNLATEYIESGFSFERELLKNINKNILRRDGKVLHIESRMLKSIDDMEKFSAVDISSIDPKKKGWGKQRDIAGKSSNIGWTNLYDGIYKNTSRNVHGDWSDIYENHLTVDGLGMFSPKLEWQTLRVQSLTSLSLIVLDTLHDAIPFLSDNNPPQHMMDHIDDLEHRITLLDQRHEEFLQQRGRSVNEPK